MYRRQTVHGSVDSSRLNATRTPPSLSRE
jgi:hypothetical protein